MVVFPLIRSVRLNAATAWAGRHRTDHAASAVHEGARSLSDTGAQEASPLTVRPLLCDIWCSELLSLLNVGYYKGLLLKFEGFPCL